MPIHARFAEHVKNAALAALINARAKIKREPSREFTGTDIDNYMLKEERRRREISVGNPGDYKTCLTSLRAETPPAIQTGDFYDLTSPDTTTYIQTFFGINAQATVGTPKAYLIRHKNRSELKRVELVLEEAGNDDPWVTVMWQDK